MDAENINFKGNFCIRISKIFLPHLFVSKLINPRNFETSALLFSKQGLCADLGFYLCWAKINMESDAMAYLEKCHLIILNVKLCSVLYLITKLNNKEGIVCGCVRCGHVGRPMVLLLLVTASTLQTGDTGHRGHPDSTPGPHHHRPLQHHQPRQSRTPDTRQPQKPDTRQHKRNLQKKVWKIPHLGAEIQ